MKKVLFIAILFISSMANAQMPVTDVAANTQMAFINKQLVLLNKMMIKINANLVKMNAQLKSANAINKKNATSNSGALKLATQDNTAKRKAPTFLLNSPEMTGLFELKDKIIATYRSSKDNLDSFQHLRPNEISEAKKDLSQVISNVSVLVGQATNVAASPELIEPGLRLSSITNIVDKLNDVLDSVTALNERLKQKNAHRKSLNSIITTN